MLSLQLTLLSCSILLLHCYSVYYYIAFILQVWPNVAVPLAGLVNPAAVLLPSYGWVVIVMSYQGCFGSDCPLQVRTDGLCHPIQVTEPHTCLLPSLYHTLQSLLEGCVTILTNWISANMIFVYITKLDNSSMQIATGCTALLAGGT